MLMQATCKWITFELETSIYRVIDVDNRLFGQLVSCFPLLSLPHTGQTKLQLTDGTYFLLMLPLPTTVLVTQNSIYIYLYDL